MFPSHVLARTTALQQRHVPQGSRGTASGFRRIGSTHLLVLLAALTSLALLNIFSTPQGFSNTRMEDTELNAVLQDASNEFAVQVAGSSRSHVNLQADHASLPAANITDDILVFMGEEDDPHNDTARCAANIYSTYQLKANGVMERTRHLSVKNLGTVFQFSKRWRYAHMATIAHLKGDKVTRGVAKAEGREDNAHPGKAPLVLAAAWQAAPAVQNSDGTVKLAVEGLETQRILITFSMDGGKTWQAPSVVPTELKVGSARAMPSWSPVLHFDEPRDRLLLFFTQSKSCRRATKPATWDPGGSVYSVSLSLPSILARLKDREAILRWSLPHLILSQQGDDIPKVIANSLLVMSNGHWALPFWREQPHKSDHGPASTCHVDDPAVEASMSSAGVLISANAGDTWQVYGSLTDPRTSLIEGSLVELLPSDPYFLIQNPMHKPRLRMFFRTSTGCAFQTESIDGGTTWSVSSPINLPNPNTKFHILRLQYSGHLAIAFNDHHRNQFCKACRTHLHVAMSNDEGASWRYIAHIDREEENGVRIHYPTLLEHGDSLYVIYSRFYLDLGKCKSMRDKLACRGVGSSNQGIKIAKIDMSTIDTLPQLFLPTDSERPEPPMHFVIDNFLLEVFSRYLLRSVLGMIHIGSDCSLHLDILFSPLLSMP